MCPIINIGVFHIPSYSLMVFLGAVLFTVSTILIIERGLGMAQSVTNRLLIISAAGFAVMALSALFFNSVFHSIEEGRLVIGGITWLGGVLGSFPVSVLLVKKFCPVAKGKSLTYFGYLIPGLTLAHALGRVGCFLGGCCYGMVTDSFLGVRFPQGSEAESRFPDELLGTSLPLLPTQLIEAVFDILLFLVMVIFIKRLSKRYLEMYCISYGVFRFILEFFRADDRGSVGTVLTPSQAMSILLIVAGVIIIVFKARRSEICEQENNIDEEYININEDSCR